MMPGIRGFRPVEPLDFYAVIRRMTMEWNVSRRDLALFATVLVVGAGACGGGDDDKPTPTPVYNNPDADAGSMTDTGPETDTGEDTGEEDGGGVQGVDDSESENNDPLRGGGTPNVIDVEPVGEQTVFAGTIDEPSDLDEDGTDDQDVDVFSFEAEAGQWFELSALSRGLPEPHFRVRGPQGYLRTSSERDEEARRHLAIPRDGTYKIRIAPSEWATVEDAEPIGGSDWDYRGYLKQVDPPSASEATWKDEPLSGDVATLTDNFYKVTDFSQGQVARLTVDKLGTGMKATELSFWRDKSTFTKSILVSSGDEVTANVPVSGAGSFYVLVDARMVTGADTAFDISAAEEQVEDLGSVETGESKESGAKDAGGKATVYYSISIDKGQFLEVSQKNAKKNAAQFELFDEDGNVVAQSRQLSDYRQTSAAAGYLYYYSPRDQKLLLKVLSPINKMLPGLVVRLRARTPEDLGAGGHGETLNSTRTEELLAGQSGLYQFEISEKALVDLFATPSGEQKLQLYLYDSEYEQIDKAVGGTGKQTLTDNILETGSYFVRVSTLATIADPAYTLEASIQKP